MRFRRQTVGWFEPPVPHRRPRRASEAKRGQSVVPEPIEGKRPRLPFGPPLQSRAGWLFAGLRRARPSVPGRDSASPTAEGEGE